MRLMIRFMQLMMRKSFLHLLVENRQQYQYGGAFWTQRILKLWLKPTKKVWLAKECFFETSVRSRHFQLVQPINRLINVMYQSINGIIRLINGWGPAGGPQAAAGGMGGGSPGPGRAAQPLISQIMRLMIRFMQLISDHPIRDPPTTVI